MSRGAASDSSEVKFLRILAITTSVPVLPTPDGRGSVRSKAAKLVACPLMVKSTSPPFFWLVVFQLINVPNANALKRPFPDLPWILRPFLVRFVEVFHELPKLPNRDSASS